MNVFSSILRSARILPQKKQLNFFVHVPKTAGTSFRDSLESNTCVISDYGDSRPQTSDIVQKWAYVKNDIYSLQQHIETKTSWLCGHVWLTKYSGLVPAENIATIVREPIERVISHYSHEMRWGMSDNMDLETFLRSSQAKNTQSRYLAGVPISLIGAVGITEDYENSLKLINHQFNTTLSNTLKNVNEDKARLRDALPQSAIQRIIEQNQKDIALYDQAKALQSQRLNFLEKGLPWTYMYAHVNKRNEVSGIVFRSNNTSPISVRLYRESAVLFDGEAAQHTPEFPDINFPRGRYVGFTVKLTPSQLKSSAPFKLQCKDTLQAFYFNN